jgi:DNA invertase Pin-like site-specific DNA recombinase
MQADSLDIQDEILRRFAVENGFTVTRVYEDSGSGRSADTREGFSALIDDVAANRANVDAILVRDVSRWGRFENIDESAYYEFICLRHGVEVIYVEEGLGGQPSPFSALTKAMKRVLAAEFSRDKSRIITRGKYRTAAQGFRFGGPAPFGMKRVLVKRDDGTYVADLPPGTQKLMSCYKTKLAPGDAQEVEVVRTIFRLFTAGMRCFTEIAETLNTAGVPSPKSRTWHGVTVRHILCNPAYAGIVALRPTNGDERIVVSGAHPAIIDPDTFVTVQRECERVRIARPATVTRLMNQAREAFARYGSVPAEVLGNAIEALGRGGRRMLAADDLLASIFVSSIAGEKRRIAEALERDFAVENHGAYLTLNGTVTVGFIVGWCRTDLLFAPVAFSTCPESPADLIVLVGAEHDPEFNRISRYVVDSASLSALASTVPAILRYPHTKRPLLPLYPAETDAELRRSVRRLIWRNRSLAAAELRRVTAGDARVSIAAVSRKLKWSYDIVKRVYRDLAVAGEPLPQRSHARVKREPKPPRQAAPKLVATCPECGAVRLVYPSQMRAMKRGLDSLCHQCALASGRAYTLGRNREMRPIRRSKRDFLHDLALAVWSVMLRRPHEFERPRVWTAQRRLGTIMWREPGAPRANNRLSLDCSEEFMNRCLTMPGAGTPDVTLLDSILDRTWWKGGSVDAAGRAHWVRYLG